VDGEWIKPLIHLMRRGVIPTLILIDPTTFGAASGPRHVTQTLSELGVAHHVVKRDLLLQPEARPGARGQWDWHITTTGKAIPIRTPGDMSWRKLS
jgi:hypothetical protein